MPAAKQVLLNGLSSSATVSNCQSQTAGLPFATNGPEGYTLVITGCSAKVGHHRPNRTVQKARFLHAALKLDSTDNRHRPRLLSESEASVVLLLLGRGGRDDAEEGPLRAIGHIIPAPCGCHKVTILGTRALASCAPTNNVNVEELREVRLVWSRYNEVSDEQAT